MLRRPVNAAVRRELLCAGDVAAALHQNGVAPTAVEASDTLSGAHRSEPAGGVEEDAGLVLREYTGLESPHSRRFGCCNQGMKQELSDANAPATLGDVDAHLGYTGVRLTGRHGAKGGPADDLLTLSLATKRQSGR